MARVLPPLNPLRVFEAAARHVHFTRAAEELGITQAAVSRQVLTLETWLGIKLFERRNTDLRLTEEGSQYLTALSQVFDLVEASTARVAGKSERSTINLRAYATFAMRWLIPRLPRFRCLHPEIMIDLKTSVTPVEFRPDETNLFIDYGTGSELEGVISQRIFDDVIAPVCSPKLLQGKTHPDRPADLRNYPLLHSRRRPRDWSDWFSYVGVDPAPGNACVFDNSSLTYQASKEGIGVAMGQLRLLETELATSELMIPVERLLERSFGYYLIYPLRVRQDSRVMAFHSWIVDEARGTR